MSNKIIYNILIRHNLNQVKPVLQDIIDEMRTIQQTRIQLDARNINSMYLDNHQYAWNIFRGITPNHSIQEDDFKYANGDIDIGQLLDGQDRLITQIQSAVKNFERRFTQITKQAVDYNEKKISPIVNRNLIDENLAGKRGFDSVFSDKLEAMINIYTNAIRKLSQNDKPNSEQYRKLEQLTNDIQNAIHSFDNTIHAQNLGMTGDLEAYWRIAAAQGAYNGENLNEAQNGEMGASYQQLIEDADEIEKQIKQLPATDIKDIARLAQTLDQLNQRIAFLGAALNLKNEPFHRQTMINQAKKLNEQAAQEQQVPDDVDKLNNIKKLQMAIDFYKKQLLNADKEELQAIDEIIAQIQNKKNAINDIADIEQIKSITDELKKVKGYKLKVEVDKIGLQNIQSYILKLQNILINAGDSISEKQRQQIQKLIRQWQKYAKVAKASTISFKKAWNAVEDIGFGIENISNLCKGGASDWQIFTGIVDSAIQIFEGFAEVVNIIKTLAAVSKAATTEQTTAAAADTVSTKVEAMAYRELAASEFMAAHAGIPFVGAGIAEGFIAQMLATVGAVAATPFANGGIVYGPTIALTGEYAGASSNPEVIAPLSKLKDIIAGKGHYVEVVGDNRTIKAVVKGQDIEIALANTTRIHRKKSNIRI